MHFFYIDESGDTGANLEDAHQPVFVLGGISVRDEGWNTTQDQLHRKLAEFFGGALPANFELHAKDLLSPQGDGPFRNASLEQRGALCLELLSLIEARAHSIHYLALDKRRIQQSVLNLPLSYDHRQPYLLAFDYLITFVNWQVRERLGASARGMIILDKKDEHHEQIERLMHERRFGGTAAHRVKWIVEFSYAVDSNKNPMVQLSDLVIYCIKRFIEVENGYRNGWSPEAKTFYARCYSIIKNRLSRTTLAQRPGRDMDQLNSHLQLVRAEPRTRWRSHYAVD